MGRQHRKECLLGYLHTSHDLQPLFPLLLLLQQLPLPGNVPTVTLGSNVLPHGSDGLSGNYPATNGRLDDHLKEVAWYLLSELFCKSFTFIISLVLVDYAGEGIYLFAPDQYVQPYQVRRAVTQEGVVHSPISPRGRFEFVVEVKYHLCQGQLIVKDYPLFAQVLGADVLTPALLAYLHYCAYVFTRQDYLHGHYWLPELLYVSFHGHVEGDIEEFREPIVAMKIVLPSEYIGAVMQICEERRGKYISTEYLSEKRVILNYELPLAEVIFDFYDKLKSATRGYGTMDYTFLGYRPADLVKLDILVGGKKVDALSSIVHRNQAYYKGKRLAKKLREEIPRHLFEVVIQAAIGSRIIAREAIRPMRKDVTAKCYGGDITRKRKLLEKQKEGKKRLKVVGSVEIPQEAFLSVLTPHE